MKRDPAIAPAPPPDPEAARKREAALREVLDLIGRSRSDPAPVFKTILRLMAELCTAHAAALVTGKATDTHQQIVAQFGEEAETDAMYDRGEVAMDPDNSFAAQAIVTGKVVHVADMRDTDLYRRGVKIVVSAVRDTGIRTNMWVPLLTPEGAIGCFIIYRKDVRSYTPDEIAIAETFAAQAIIAIENAEQFREVQARLAREVATREILSVISQFPDDEKPVFDMILSNACRLCNAQLAFMVQVDNSGEYIVCSAQRGCMSEFSATLEVFHEPLANSPLSSAVAIREKRSIRVDDIADDELYRNGEPNRVDMVELEGIRSLLVVPMLGGDRGIGAILLYRRKVAPFFDEDAALIETFAAQAVIAIENVRQFRELQTRLAREAATREILEVISQSRDDDRPVFDAILRRVARLCDAHAAALVMATAGDTHERLVAAFGLDPATAAFYYRGEMRFDPDGSLAAKAIMTAKTIHIDDMFDLDGYREGHGIDVSAVRDSGIRTIMFVPLLTPSGGIGSFNIFRKEVRPFTHDEIALVETFAAQAVIAIENVRQFRELQVRLEREKASAEILEIISQSRDDDAPVFDAILRRAAHLCDAHAAALALGKLGDTHQRLVATHGVDAATIALYDRAEVSMDPDISLAAAAILTGKVVHVHDMMNTEGYRRGVGHFVSVVRDTGVRTQMFVPLMTAAGGIGCFIIFRKDVRPYTADEIALAETFAAQAVIAIENVSQFRELQTRLEREKASAAILEVISQSRDDEGPVFDAVLRNANRLCGTSMAYLVLGRPDDTHMTLAAYVNPYLESEDSVDQIITFANQTAMRMDAAEHFSAKAILSGEVVQIADIATTPGYLSGEPTTRILVEDVGVRTILSVPMFDAQGAIGAISLQRREERLFSDDEVTLIQSFAAQAVIAIENVRQFRELQTRLAREKASSEILQVISQSRDDEGPVFDVIAKRAAGLCGAAICTFWRVKDGSIHYCASHGLDSASFAETRSTPSIPLLDNTLVGQVVKTRAVVRIEDGTAESYLDHKWAQRQGLRQLIGVPIFIGDEVWGSVNLMWPADRVPGDADVQLVETFAAQASIAIENVRQFREVQERLAREAATREILEVISRNPDDDRPVFDVILRNVINLCAGDTSALLMGRKDDPRMTMAAWRDRESGSSVMDDAMIAQINATEMLMDPRVHVSAQVIVEARNIHVLDVLLHPSYLAGEPSYRIMGDALGIRSALVVPLIGARGALGAVHVHRRAVRPFTDDEIALVETFAAQAVIAIENVRQFKALEALNAELGDRVQAQVGEIERMGRLKRFLPAAVADAVVSSGSERLLSSHRALLGVLFCDMRGFTAFCETAEPEETIEVLQTYYEEMGQLINAHGAGVDQRIGDGMMVLFNDPLPCDDPAGSAVRLAVAMRDRMAELCAKWKKMGHRLGFGAGVSLGYATVGMVGSGGRMDYTASGTAVNLAARLCDDALDGEVLISPRARAAVEGVFAVTSRGEIAFKGIREPVEVFCVTGVEG